MTLSSRKVAASAFAGWQGVEHLARKLLAPYCTSRYRTVRNEYRGTAATRGKGAVGELNRMRQDARFISCSASPHALLVVSMQRLGMQMWWKGEVHDA